MEKRFAFRWMNKIYCWYIDLQLNLYISMSVGVFITEFYLVTCVTPSIKHLFLIYSKHNIVFWISELTCGQSGADHFV